MSNTDFLGRAIDVVKKAIENDTAGEYEKAYQQYYNACTPSMSLRRRRRTLTWAVELFMLALKCRSTMEPGSSPR